MRSEVVIALDDTPYWIRYFHARVRNNKNFLGLVTGMPGTGKSYSCLAIGELYDKENFTMERVVFTAKDLFLLLNKCKCTHGMEDHPENEQTEIRKCKLCPCDHHRYYLNPGSYVVFEEAGIDLDSAQWQQTMQKFMKYILETFRYRRLIIIFNAPYAKFMMKSGRMLLNAVFETQPIDYKTNRTCLKPLTLQHNEWNGNTYRKYLRVNIPGSGLAPVVQWKLVKPSEEIIKAYEKKKGAWNRRLNATMLKELTMLEHDTEKVKYPHTCVREACAFKWSSLKEDPLKCPRCNARYAAAKDKTIKD